MKKILFLLCLGVVLSACSKEDVEAIDTTGGTTLPAESKLTVLASGDFVKSGNYNTAGKAELLKDDTGVNYIRLTSFSVSSGPDLRFYIAADKAAKDFVEISNSVKGGSYAIKLSKPVDLTKTKFLLIWCKQFSVLFGSVELK
jgi:hypothetical protein